VVVHCQLYHYYVNHTTIEMGMVWEK